MKHEIYNLGRGPPGLHNYRCGGEEKSFFFEWSNFNHFYPAFKTPMKQLSRNL